MISPMGASVPAVPEIGDRMVDRSAPPDESKVRDWIGPDAFRQWAALQDWIATFYPGVFAPDWLFGGQKRGWSLRYKQVRAFCTLLPEYRRLSVTVVLGGAEREKFEEQRYAWRSTLVELYDQSRTYIDGKWLTVTVGSDDDLYELKKLLTMKRPPSSRS